MLTKKITQVVALIMFLISSMYVHAVEVSDAWIREAPPAARMLGGFMTINNHSDKEMILVGASSKTFKHIMLHRTMEVEGVSKMIHQDQVVIPAHGTLVFKPGDYHIMMPAPEKRLVAGDKVMVTLKFKSGKIQKVEYTVRKGNGGTYHQGHSMQDMDKKHDMHGGGHHH